MQGTIKGRTGIALMLVGGVGTFEAKDGETYGIHYDKVNETFLVTHDVWNEAMQDWEGEEIEETWEAFARQHHITSVTQMRLGTRGWLTRTH